MTLRAVMDLDCKDCELRSTKECPYDGSCGIEPRRCVLYTPKSTLAKILDLILSGGKKQ